MTMAWTRYALAVLSVVVAGCSGAAGRTPGDAATPAPPKHWIFAADLSASLNENQLRESQQLVESVIGKVRNGDKLTLLRVYERGLASSNFVWPYEIPAARNPVKPTASDSLEIEDFAQALRAELTVLFDPTVQGTLQATDIFSTLFRVSDIARDDHARRTTLFLLSDMLQATRELNLERTVPETTWVYDRAARKLLPDLTGVCVVAVGPDVSNARGQRVLAFWRTYFRAAGAELRDGNYRNWASGISGLGCE